MVTFFIGLAILLVGGFFYSKLAVRVFGPDDRKTPCYTKADGVDFVPMPCWKNSLINLLNIAGTGPILALFKVYFSAPLPSSPFLWEMLWGVHCTTISPA